MRVWAWKLKLMPVSVEIPPHHSNRRAKPPAFSFYPTLIPTRLKLFYNKLHYTIVVLDDDSIVFIHKLNYTVVLVASLGPSLPISPPLQL